MEWLTNWFWDLLYGLAYIIMQLIDDIFEVAKFLCGLDGKEPGEGTNILGELTGGDSQIMPIFMVIIMLSVGLLMFFSIATMFRAMLRGSEHKDVKTVSKGVFKSVVAFITVPFLIMLLIYCCNTIMGAIYTSFDFGENSGSFGRMLAKSGLDSSSATTLDKDFPTDYSANAILSVTNGWSNYNVWIPLVGSIVVFIPFCGVLIIFIMRIYDILTLLLKMPIVASTMPTDGGERFEAWRSEFFKTVISGYSTLIAFLVCMLVSQQFVTIKSSFFESNPLLAGVFKILVIYGGVLAAKIMASKIENFICASVPQKTFSTGGKVKSDGGTVEARENGKKGNSSGATSMAGKTLSVARKGGLAVATGVTGLSAVLTRGKVGQRSYEKFRNVLSGGKYLQHKNLNQQYKEKKLSQRQAVSSVSKNAQQKKYRVRKTGNLKNSAKK